MFSKENKQKDQSENTQEHQVNDNHQYKNTNKDKEADNSKENKTKKEKYSKNDGSSTTTSDQNEHNILNNQNNYININAPNSEEVDSNFHTDLSNKPKPFGNKEKEEVENISKPKIINSVNGDKETDTVKREERTFKKIKSSKTYLVGPDKPKSIVNVKGRKTQGAQQNEEETEKNNQPYNQGSLGEFEETNINNINQSPNIIQDEATTNLIDNNNAEKQNKNGVKKDGCCCCDCCPCKKCLIF